MARSFESISSKKRSVKLKAKGRTMSRSCGRSFSFEIWGQKLWGVSGWRSHNYTCLFMVYVNFELMRSILEFGMMLHLRSFRVQWFLGRFDASGCWRMERFTHLRFWHLNLSQSLSHCQRIDSLLKELDGIGTFFTIKLLIVYWIWFISRVFFWTSSTARFEFLHIPMQVALCAPPVNMERVSGQMWEPAHQSCTASGFAVIELMYAHNYILIYII